MSCTYRWYRVGVPRDKNIVDFICGRVFNAASECGFVLLEESDQVPKLRFLWRTRVTVTRIDESGRPVTEDLASINFIDFFIINKKKKVYLRLENSGHGARHLFDALEDIFGLGFTCEHIRLQVSRPDDMFSNVDSAKLIGLVISNATLGPDLVAKVEMVSKAGINVKEVGFLNRLQYKVDSSAFELIYGGLRGQVTFTSGGSVKISGRLEPVILALVESHITASE